MEIFKGSKTTNELIIVLYGKLAPPPPSIFVNPPPPALRFKYVEEKYHSTIF